MMEPLGKGGWAQYSYCLLTRLVSHLADVVLFTSSSTRFKDMELPYTLKPVLFSVANTIIKIFHLQKARGVRRLLKALEIPLNHLKLFMYCLVKKPDLLHFHAAYWFEALIIPLYRLLGIKLIYTAHDLLHHPPYPGDRYSFRYLYSRLDAIIVTAAALKREMGILFPGIDESKIEVIRMGNVDELEETAGISSSRARSLLSLPLSSPIILFFGIIRPYKGLEVLIRAFALVARKIPEARLVIAGEPVGSFAPYQEEIDRLDINNRVDLFLQFIPQNQTAALFSAADLVAVPYHDSYTSAIIPLSYSHHRPVVVSKVGGLAEYVEEGVSGCTFAPGDYRSMAEKMILLLSDSKELTRVKNGARRYYRANFSWEKIARATLAVYRRVISGTTESEITQNQNSRK